MHLIATRKYPFLDSETLVDRQARDTLFKIGENAFLLHMTSGEDFERERVVQLDVRAALLWINQATEEFGINWE